MTQEKWEDIKGRVKDDFEVIKEYSQQEEIGEDTAGEKVFEVKEIIEFKGPLGEIKLEFIKRPPVVEKRTNFSRRIGAEGQVKYIYSAEEVIMKLKAYKKEGEEWQELDGSIF